MMRFSALSLLSIRERRGLSVRFSPDVTVLQARNGFGKSAVMKSLYETFGAVPHKIDGSWKSAHVASLVEFSIEDARFWALRSGSRYIVFDASGKRLIDTASVTSELAPFLADLLGFRLLMTDRTGESVVPPPAYIFAPFYIDQDKSWSAAWQPFDRMYLPNSSKALSEYHTGVRSNAYYEARARRDRTQAALDVAMTQREAVTRALAEIRAMVPPGALNFSLEDFTAEVEALVVQSNELREMQARYRSRLTEFESERALWSEQQQIIRQSIAEMRDTVHVAASQPGTVECPTCGQEYENSLAEQFGLVENFDDLFDAYQEGRDRIATLEAAIQKQRSSLRSVELKLREVEETLGQARSDTTLDDVIAARGRTETAEALRRRLAAVDEELGTALAELKRADAELRRATDGKRTARITNYFASRYVEFASELDVRAGSGPKGVSPLGLARGSEGPRSLISYYYSVLHTALEFGSSVFCPIVVDAPNQQGQDALHLPAILRFLMDRRPGGSQVIIASEEAFDLREYGAAVIEVGVTKNQVLREGDYAAVSEMMRPFLGQLL